MEAIMTDNVVTLSVSSIEEINARVLAAVATGKPQRPRISFASIELMWRVLNPKRLEIIQAMTGQGPLSIREVARRVGRDVKAVHGDVTALVSAGVVERDGRKVVFPYDGVHVDFMLGMAA
jgi:predicted transcriptional regulator